MYIPRLQQGFTLIEMIVSLAVFSIVITISVGALLVLVATNQQLQSEQSVMTNLSFALDSMTREIRTGILYNCVSGATNGVGTVFNDSSNLDTLVGTTYRDCGSGNNNNHRFHGVSFIEGGNSITGGSDRILYYYDSTEKKIFRRVGSGASESIVSTGIVIEDMDFFVSGSRPQSDGETGILTQPAVTIFIKATEKGDASNKPYYLQTTVTQRTIDV